MILLLRPCVPPLGAAAAAASHPQARRRCRHCRRRRSPTVATSAPSPQDELLGLKQQVPGLSLKRSTAAQSADAPFPITARAEVAAPPAAERYDVQAFDLAVRLGPGAAAAAAQPEALAAAVTVEVVSPELPARLRLRMAQELQQLWLQTGPAPGRLNLAGLWEAAQQRYIHLLTLLPEVLEAYQVGGLVGGRVVGRTWAASGRTHAAPL